MMLYMFICYTIMLGMIIENYHKRSIPGEAWFMFILSPFMLPVLIGMMLVEKSKDNERSTN
jgi:heme O synthase-like polyprenyltransferase